MQVLAPRCLIRKPGYIDTAHERLELSSTIARAATVDAIGAANLHAPLGGGTQRHVLIEHQPSPFASLGVDEGFDLGVWVISSPPSLLSSAALCALARANGAKEEAASLVLACEAASAGH